MRFRYALFPSASLAALHAAFRAAFPAVMSVMAVIAVLWGSGCLGGGNSGSETTNGLSGRVRDGGGSPVAHAYVSLLAEDFNPGAGAAPAARAWTDAGGRYAFGGISPGRYHLEIQDSARGEAALLQDVVVEDAGRTVRDAATGRMGSIEVRVADFPGGKNGYVFVPGTSVWRMLDAAAQATGRMRLERVPAGRFADVLLAWNEGSDQRFIALAHEVDVRPDSTTAPAPFQTWRYSRAIPLNTAAMGIAEQVTDFPLLVRLDSGGFDFSQAQPDGRDLRFSRTGGTDLPFQIERWDAAAKRAWVWVRIDTVRGNDAGQAIMMHWGRASADLPAGPAAFDSTAGFATVYHLSEDANSDPGGYKDATPYANHATAAQANPDARVPGVIGSAKAFTAAPGSTLGTLAAKVPPGFGGNAGFTVSFWMRISMGPNRQGILDFGGTGSQQGVHWLMRPDTTVQFGAFEGGTPATETAVWQNVFKMNRDVGSWAHIATVYDPARSSLITYVNGERADSVSAPAMAVDAAGGLRIGMALDLNITPPEAPLNGALDELRFVTRPLSPARVRLDYLTQKP